MNKTIETTENGERYVWISYLEISISRHLGETFNQIAEKLALEAGLLLPLRVGLPAEGGKVPVYEDRNHSDSESFSREVD